MPTWQEKCRAAGGTPTVFPPQFGSDAGAPACRFGGGSVPLSYQAGELSFSEQFSTWWDKTKDVGAIRRGAVVEARDTALGAVGSATGLNRGLAGVAGKILGVPPFLVLAAAVYIGYRILERETR